MKEIETLDTRIAYENRWMKVREDQIRRASGEQGIFGVVEKPDFVAIIPVENGYIHLVEQFRYPVDGRYWEIPQGSWEDNTEVEIEIVAAGELREETGLVAGKMSYIAHIYQAYGYSNQGFHLFFATDLVEKEQQLDNEEEGLITKKFTIAEFESMIVDGIVKDATTISAFGYAKLRSLI